MLLQKALLCRLCGQQAAGEPVNAAAVRTLGSAVVYLRRKGIQQMKRQDKLGIKKAFTDGLQQMEGPGSKFRKLQQARAFVAGVSSVV